MWRWIGGRTSPSKLASFDEQGSAAVTSHKPRGLSFTSEISIATK
jgi:hypothetical protein